MEISTRSLLKKYHDLTSFRFVEFFFFCFCALIFINEWMLAYQLRFIPDIFDDSLKLLSGLYTSFNFIPYTDFAIVYPPGLLILSKMLSLNFASRYHAFAAIYLLLSIPIFVFVVWKSKSWFVSGALLLLLALSISIAGDVLLNISWFVLFVATFFYLEKNGRVGKWAIPVMIGVLCFFKWERVVVFAVLMAVGWMITHFTSHGSSKRFLYLCKATIIASLASFGIFLLYLIMAGSEIGSALYFVFSVPLKILPYRSLPLPSLFPLQGNLLGVEYSVYFSLFLLVGLGLLVTRSILKEQKFEHLLFLIMPLVVLPYALGRADSIHAFPLLSTLLLSLILFSIVEKRAIALLVVLVVYFVVNYNLFSYDPSRFLHRSSTYVDVLDLSLQDCRQATQDVDYQSLFVGRTNYSAYIYSHVMLYFINPKIKPATKYISDEPGLQNDCGDGENIARDLARAPKPMLSFLETQPQPTEKNMSSNMVSCGYIEKWLANNPYREIGTCSHYGKEFAILLYE